MLSLCGGNIYIRKHSTIRCRWNFDWLVEDTIKGWFMRPSDRHNARLSFRRAWQAIFSGQKDNPNHVLDAGEESGSLCESIT
ncbi:hypothetical protein LIER_07416 [Lithospermum erythrorhizon]|uniref:Uncharacterized protein n=1 Tax=Lithospermum erythrorhizon TaxID=34254 RepID=A0AAV3P979_LITER